MNRISSISVRYDNLSVVDLDAIAHRLRTAAADPGRTHADALELLAEVRRLRLALAVTRQRYADLLEAVRSATAGVDSDLVAPAEQPVRPDPDAPITFRLTDRAGAFLGHRDGAES